MRSESTSAFGQPSDTNEMRGGLFTRNSDLRSGWVHAPAIGTTSQKGQAPPGSSLNRIGPMHRGRRMTSRIPQPPLLLVTDRRQARGPLEAVVAAALSAGCRWVSVREKDLPADQQILLARSLLPL